VRRTIGGDVSTIKVGDVVYGWGPDVAPLPLDPLGAGPAQLDDAAVSELVAAVFAGGEHIPFATAEITGEEVFVIQPKAWKRKILVRELGGSKTLQVRPRSEDEKASHEATMVAAREAAAAEAQEEEEAAAAAKLEEEGQSEPEPSKEFMDDGPVGDSTHGDEAEADDPGEGDEQPEPPKEREGA
jgi:hypothetical protein